MIEMTFLNVGRTVGIVVPDHMKVTVFSKRYTEITAYRKRLQTSSLPVLLWADRGQVWFRKTDFPYNWLVEGSILEVTSQGQRIEAQAASSIEFVSDVERTVYIKELKAIRLSLVGRNLDIRVRFKLKKS